MAVLIVFVTILIGMLGHMRIEGLIQRIWGRGRNCAANIKRGRELQDGLRDFFSLAQGSNILPQYKFFTPYFYELKELQLRHGIGPSQLVQGLRPWITRDLQFEEKIQGLLKNSLGQFLILSIFTWIFYLNAISSLGAELSWVGFFSLQLIGFLCFLWVFHNEKGRFFDGLDELYKRLFLFQSLKKVGLPMGEVLTRSLADQSLIVKDSKVRDLAKQLMTASHLWTREGRAIDTELGELAQELRFLREQKRRSFEIKLAALRFVHLVGFYLLGYLLVVLGLIRQLASSY